ncbi:MAG: lipopolysaccharide biosynthesis protein [Lacisediminihabitans sp.]
MSDPAGPPDGLATGLGADIGATPDPGKAPEIGLEPGLGARAARGAAITLGAQGGRMIVQVASVVVLARLLTPHDYGLIAMVVAIIGVGELLRDFGLSSAAIQAPELSVPQRDNLFWINSGIGVGLAVIVYFGAGILELVYQQAELISIAHALCLTFLINGLATQYRADLVRRLKFTRLALADILAPTLALIFAIAAGLLGWGYWALVVQQLTQASVLLIVVAVSAGWLPRLPRRHTNLGPLLRFGSNLMATQLVGYISNNVDSVVIGVRFGAVSLGFYSRAFQLLMTPLNQVRIPLTTVALPVLSRIGGDIRRFGGYIVQGQLVLGYTLVAGLALAVGAAEPITEIFLGHRWVSVAPLLALLAAAGIFQTLAFVGYWVYVSRALTSQLLRYTLLSSAIKVVCIVAGSYWGVVGVAAGYALAPALSWPISFWWLSRHTELPLRRLYAGAGRILALVVIASGAAGAVALWLRGGGAWLQLGGAIVAVGVVYALAAAILPPIRRDASVVLRIIRMIPGRRSRGAV